MLPYFRPYLFRTFLALGLAIPIGALDAVIALALKPYMDIVMLNKHIHSTWYIPFLIILFTTIQGSLNYLATYMNDWVGGRVTNDLKIDLYTKLMRQSSYFFDKQTSGKVLKAYNNDADKSCSGLLSNMKSCISRLFSSISLIGVLFYNSWQLAIIAVSVLTCAMIPLMKMKSAIKDVYNRSEGENAKVLTTYNEAFGGNKIIAAYNLYDLNSKKFSELVHNVFNLKMKITQHVGWLSPMMHIIVSVGIGAVIGLGSYFIVKGSLTAGQFVSFITALIMLYTPIKGLGNNAKNMTTCLCAMDRVVSKLDKKTGFQDKKDAVDFPKFSEKITFDDVSFYYKKDVYVLHNISFEVKKGETIALVGNSGGGKTTIVNLLPRFYNTKGGDIKIDGTSIYKIKIDDLRANIAVVFQDNFLFEGTIRDNIMIGNLNATKEELQQAIKNSYLDDFINSLEKGLDTPIGERGVLLSGGQKQRIGIARAFLKNAPILVLDEATSALDNQAEHIVQQAIDNLMKDRTVFVIAHRLSTIQNADKIAVINHGYLTEMGTHDELLGISNGEYKKLYDMQFA
ncbi:TPA: ABC transporter [Candidatus Gastranaerophilales bacterium HUM_6]|nr:MAG TPA: ABC transporter [Candidatus Gastranaerophilales bacterium HUM_7]DAA91692.1 MAG TPA: ABC transporter [Candidatus Gastranaerophilales bacterium HUM_6]DAB00150.1 MAG TPA: ABC transporter [Candidatus Gastranaerophilales bacterium HUM_12]DAB06914.1 MAG TPA: ABC transporter [Candidatus Gastranaerophilales bacterium HUM_14]